MRRLSALVRREPERGATTILVAGLMTLLLAFTGLAVDLGASYAKKTELQNGADAAALALAQEYAKTICVADSTMATEWVKGNVRHASDDTEGTAVCPTNNSVRVVADDLQKHWFLPVLGINESEVGADATVEWGSPTKGEVVFPMAFSTCEFEAQLEEGVFELNTTKDSDTYGEVECDYADTWPTAGNNFPGGFGFLLGEDKDCTPTLEVGTWVESNNGNSVGGLGCTFPPLEFTALIPLFDDCKTGSPSVSAACRYDEGTPTDESWYRISKFAGFRIVGYDFNAGIKDGEPCKKGPCIRGEFTDYVEVPPDVEIGLPDPESVIIIRLID